MLIRMSVLFSDAGGAAHAHAAAQRALRRASMSELLAIMARTERCFSAMVSYFMLLRGAFQLLPPCQAG